MTEQATQLDPEIMIPALVTSTKSTASVQSSSPITVDEQDWTQESTVGPKKLLCTPEYDSSYQTQGYTTNDNKNSELCTPNTRHHRQSSGSDPLSPTKPGVSRELNFTAINPPKHQSTPLRENTNGKNNSNRKNGRKSKKNKRTANRRPSEVVAKNQAENSSEEETEEYEVFIAVPEKRTAELIGKQGSHLKKYYKEYEVDITIVPGPEFSENFESSPPLKRVNSVVVQNVFRFESYYQENIKTVLQDMQQKFWKADTILTQIAIVSTINEDFFNDYWHDRGYYAKSHFLQPKPNQRSGHNSERNTTNNVSKYNFTHSIPDSTEKWESLVQEQEQTEEDRLRQMMVGQTSFDQAMGIPMENDCPDARSWRTNNNNGNNKSKKKNQRNQKKARTQKAKWRGKDGLCCPCTHLSVDKRSEARIYISHTNPSSNTLYIQQPTHPSFSTLAYLENNLFHCYDPKGEAFNADKVPSVVDREEARTCEHYVTVADPYQPEAKYVRGKIEGYSDDDDVCTIFFCDYGGSLAYHRTDVFKLAREFCQLPFQACLVEVEPCFENDFGTQNSNISNSAGEATQTTSGSTDEETEQELARMRSSTVLVETSEVTDVEPPMLSKVESSVTHCVSPSKTAESVCSNVKTKRNQFQKQILDCENVQFETYTDVTQFATIYELYCEVVMEIEDIDREESIPHIRIYRYDFSKGVKQKCYIDYIPHLAPVLNSPVMSPEPTVMSPVPTEDEVSFLPSDLDVSQQLASFITSDPSHLALFESLVQQNLQNLQLSTQSFAEIAREQAQFDAQEAVKFQIQNPNFNPEAQAFVPRT